MFFVFFNVDIYGQVVHLDRVQSLFFKEKKSHHEEVHDFKLDTIKSNRHQRGHLKRHQIRI
jgi:hypothetical protein